MNTVAAPGYGLQRRKETGVDSSKPQATASSGRVVLADFSIVFLKALAGGVAASIVASGIVLALARLAG
jgi:hypothetical protein